MLKAILGKRVRSLSKDAIFEEIRDSVLSMDSDDLMDTVRKALSRGIDPISIVDDGLARGLRVVGRKFEEGEFFLIELVTAAEAAQRVIKEILQPEIGKRKAKRRSLGKIVLGTVEGDIHNIGKNIVGAMLFAAGFEVYDLGVDVPVAEFVKKAREVDADVVGASALLSTTRLVQKDIVQALVEEGIREKVKVIFGGAPVTEEWVEEIGGDGYAENGVEAVDVVKRLLNIAEGSHFSL